MRVDALVEILGKYDPALQVLVGKGDGDYAYIHQIAHKRVVADAYNMNYMPFVISLN
jgi:hypothetical protein